MIEKTGLNKPKTPTELKAQHVNEAPMNIEGKVANQEPIIDTRLGESKTLDSSGVNSAQAIMGFVDGVQNNTSARVRGAQEGLDWVIKYFANKYGVDVSKLEGFTEVLSSKEAEDRGIPMMLAAAAGYYAPENVIIVNSAFEEGNPNTPKEEGAHESYHGLEVFILSTKLTKQQRDNTIEVSLVNEARNGTNASLVTPCALLGQQMINPILFHSSTVRSIVADYISNLYTIIKSENVNSPETKKVTEELGGKTREMTKISDYGLEELLTQITSSQDGNDFFKVFANDRNEAKRRLEEHINSYLFRFERYTNRLGDDFNPFVIPSTTLSKIKTPDFQLEEGSPLHQLATEALSDFMSAVEGGIRIQNNGLSEICSPKDTALSHSFSKAEIRAREAAIAMEYERVQNELSILDSNSDGKSSPAYGNLVKRRDALIAELEVNKLGREVHETRNKLVSVPQDVEKLVEIERWNRLILENSKNSSPEENLDFMIFGMMDTIQQPETGSQESIRKVAELIEERMNIQTKVFEESGLSPGNIDFSDPDTQLKMKELGKLAALRRLENGEKLVQALDNTNHPKAKQLKQALEKQIPIHRESINFDRSLLEVENRLAKPEAHVEELQILKSKEQRITELASQHTFSVSLPDEYK